MTDRLSSPTYRIPGVVYGDKKEENVITNPSLSRHLQQSRRPQSDVIMSVRPEDDNGLPSVEVEMVARNRDLGPRPTQPTGGKTLNPNSYATRKTVAQGMLDIALLTANASQLRYVLSLGQRHENYQLMVGLIVTSLVLQVALGVLMAIIGAMDINISTAQGKANILNNLITGMTGIITAVNVLLNSLGLSHDPGDADPPKQ